MIVIADGVPLLSTEPIWRRPGLPFGPSLGPPERFPYDPGPYEPSPSGPDWTVEGTLGIPRELHLEAEGLTCPPITLVADPDPLHTFSGYASTAILVAMRAANNGRVISWGWFRERATLAIPSGDALATVWVEGADTLMVATYLADAERPVVVPFRNDLPEAGAMSSASMAQVGHGPLGPNEGFLVGWLDTAGDLGDAYWTVWTVAILHLGDVGYDATIHSGPERITSAAAYDGKAAGWKYLALTSGVPGVSATVTLFDNAYTDEGLAAQDLEAVLLTPFSAETLQTDPISKADTWKRTSDASLDTSPDGDTRVIAWEQREDEPPEPGGSLIDGTHVRLVFRIDRGGVTAAGPFHVLLAGEAVEGGDVCVRVLDQWVFLAFHGRAGNVYLLRLDHTVAYTEAPDWTPMGVPGANVEGHVNYDPRIIVYTPDGAEGAPFYEDAYVGPGWLPNLDARTINGHDVVVMAWEHSDSFDLTANDSKYVAVAAFAQPHMGVIPSPITYAGGFRFDVPKDDEKSVTTYFHLAPGIVVAPETECYRLGHIRVDLSFFMVTAEQVNPEVTIHEGALVHARLAWCVPWL